MANNRSNEEMEFGLVEVFGVRADGFKYANGEDFSFGTMSPEDAKAIRDNQQSGKPWMEDYSEIYFRRAK